MSHVIAPLGARANGKGPTGNDRQIPHCEQLTRALGLWALGIRVLGLFEPWDFGAPGLLGSGTGPDAARLCFWTRVRRTRVPRQDTGQIEASARRTARDKWASPEPGPDARRGLRPAPRHSGPAGHERRPCRLGIRHRSSSRGPGFGLLPLHWAPPFSGSRPGPGAVPTRQINLLLRMGVSAGVSKRGPRTPIWPPSMSVRLV